MKPPRVERARNYDTVTELVAGKVDATNFRISAKRLLPAARADGYDGSPRNFRRQVAEQKALWRRDNHRGRRPAVWTPGDTVVIDWGVLGGLHVFCAVLAWSRVRFVRFAADERAATTLGLLAECFETLGGVPKVVLADRMGCLKGAVVANVVVPTPDYVWAIRLSRLCSERDFELRFFAWFPRRCRRGGSRHRRNWLTVPKGHRDQSEEGQT